jgi:hypothetical protein
MSTIKTTNLQAPSAASPAIVLASDGSATAQLSSLNSGPLAGMRNRILNGDMRVSQRGTSFTANGLYTLDRWTIYNSGGTFTVTQETAASGSQPEAGMSKFLRISRSSPSGIFYLTQKIEDVSLYDGYAVTVSFYAKANTNITLPVRLVQEFGSGGSAPVTVGSANMNITSSWAKYTASFTLPSLSGKTVGTSSFLECTFDTPATYSTLDITGVQLEAGSVATPFERRSYGQELALAQRYYFKSKADGSNAYLSNFGSTVDAVSARFSTALPVEMRANPTVGYSNVAIDRHTAAYSITGLAIFGSLARTVVGLSATGASGMTANQPVVLYSNSTNTGFIDYSAEL